MRDSARLLTVLGVVVSASSFRGGKVLQRVIAYPRAFKSGVPTWLAGIALVVVLSQIVSLAQAMCVYNQTDIEIDILSTCKLFCENFWDLQPGEHKCQPNKAGSVWSNWRISGDDAIAMTGVDVDRHGYVVMTRLNSDSIQICAYREDNVQTECKLFASEYALNP